MTVTTPHRIAVLGLGAMGLPMALRLAEAFDVVGYDLDPARSALAVEQGIASAESARLAVHAADTVLLTVRDESQLRGVLFGADGVVDALADGATVILGGTVGSEAARSVAAALEDSGVAFIDAPISGGPARARTGDLLIVVGGRPADVSARKAVLDQLSSDLFVVGEHAGDGQAMKTVNQLLCGVHIAAAAEALVLADRFGLDLDLALQALQTGAAASFMLKDRGARMIRQLRNEEVEVLSAADIFVKDIDIVLEAASDAASPTQVVEAARGYFARAVEQGWGRRDDSSIVLLEP